MEADNDAVIAHLMANERRWRRTLGKEAEVGAFLGRQDSWRRVSETWPDPDLGAPDLGLEYRAPPVRLRQCHRTGPAHTIIARWAFLPIPHRPPKTGVCTNRISTAAATS